MIKEIQNINLFKESCLLADGWVDINKYKKIAVYNPATDMIVGYVPHIGEDECSQAINSSKIAQMEWKNNTAAFRSKILRKWFELVQQNKNDLAKIITIEQGKPLKESLAEIDYAASFIEWFAEEGKRVDGEILQAPKSEQTLLVTKEPVGVCAAITPWNFPSAMITRKAAPALAAGCSIILKPSEETPFSAMALGVLALEAGVPLGVIQIITGDPKEIGQVLTRSPEVRKLTFTGSTPVGKLLMEQSSSTIKKLSLELGGNAALIVFEDADIDKAVLGIITAKFRNMGQTCICANRIYVHASIYQEVTEKLNKEVSKFIVGHGLDPNITHGPLINENAVSKVERHVNDALSKGALINLGGEKLSLGKNFYAPTILTNVDETMLISSEETFGPVAALFKFHNESEVIEKSNNTDYGLAAYIFTNDFKKIFRISKNIESGMIGINTGAISNEVSPFGGIKQSGLGREGSKQGIDEYIEKKYLCIDTN